MDNSTASHGGALSVAYAAAGQTYFEKTLLAGNSAALGGNAVSLRSGRAVRLVHVTIVSPSLAAGAALELISGTASITDTIFAGYAISLSRTTGKVFENYNLFFNTTTQALSALVAGSGTHDVVGDSRFINPTVLDYHLSPGSGAIDAGVSTDYDGDHRPLAPASTSGTTSLCSARFTRRWCTNGLEGPSGRFPGRLPLAYLAPVWHAPDTQSAVALEPAPERRLR